MKLIIGASCPISHSCFQIAVSSVKEHIGSGSEFLGLVFLVTDANKKFCRTHKATSCIGSGQTAK